MTYLFDPDKNFLNLSGDILANGVVYFCVPDGTANINTLKAVYTTHTLGVQASNPQTLTASGRFPQEVHGTGLYDIVIKTAALATVRTLYNVPAGYAADALNVSLTPSSGATATDVQTFLRAIYARTAAEIAASVTPTYYYYPPGDVRRYGAVSGAGDVTAAFASAALVAASHANYWPSGTWNISTVVLGDGATVITDGFSTIVSQIAGHDGSPNSQKRICVLAGSDITFAMQGLKVTGQIATDSGEQNHGVFVYKAAESLRNIRIGDLWGVNLRGDVLYIGGPAGFPVDHVTFGRVIFDNVYRQGVTITNGKYIQGGIIGPGEDGRCGLCALDIESDDGGATDIFIAGVKGRFVQVAPPNAADYADRIEIATLDLDPAYSAVSSPAYPSHISTMGLSTRNCRMLRIGNARIANFTHYAWLQTFNPGELADQRIFFGHLEVSGCGSGESTYNSPLVATNMSYVEVASGKMALQAVGDYCFYGNPAPAFSYEATRFDVSDFSCDGTVVRYAYNSRFDGIVINTTNAANAFRDMVNTTVSNSDITIPSLGTNLTNVTFANVDATCSTGYLTNTIADVYFENCSGGLAEVQTPAQWVATTNNFALTDATNILRPSTDSSHNLTGLAGGRAGRRLQLFNVGSFDLVLKNDTTSTAANRFLLGADLTIGTNEGVVLWYDSTSSRWRCASRV